MKTSSPYYKVQRNVFKANYKVQKKFFVLLIILLKLLGECVFNKCFPKLKLVNFIVYSNILNTLIETTLERGSTSSFEIFEKIFHPTCLFILCKKSTKPTCSIHPYHFSSRNIPPSLIIPATPITPDVGVDTQKCDCSSLILL